MSDNRREPGHYHVNFRGEWIVGYCNGNFWSIPGSGQYFRDSDFEEIDERPIVREVK